MSARQFRRLIVLVQSVAAHNVPVIGELELGFQQAKCLCIAIAGTNGKSTTASLVERMLLANHRKTVLAGHRARPVCSVVQQTRDLDFLILQVNAFQLGTTETFHPAVSVLDESRLPIISIDIRTRRITLRANSRLFLNQQAFDWAIIQSEALARLKELNLPIPAKTITFSAQDPEADIYLDRGLIISRLAELVRTAAGHGPLPDQRAAQCGESHGGAGGRSCVAPAAGIDVGSAENIFDRPASVSTRRGNQWRPIINDSKATNVDALHKACWRREPLLAAKPISG